MLNFDQSPRANFARKVSNFFDMGMEYLYHIALTLVPSVGPVIGKNLLRALGDPKAVFTARKRDLLAVPGVGEHIASNLLQSDWLRLAEKEIRTMEHGGIRALFFQDSEYPQRLKHFPDSPLVLFYKGQANLNPERVIGIVGTRQPTPQGVALCHEFIRDLAPLGVQVISGLAYGIDIEAHKASLENGLSTLGVLGHGLGRIYPAAHQSTARQMLESGGLLTEFASEVLPDRENFPTRNRIVAAMCDAIVVIETAARGGSIITAQLANGYHKDVFAVPGRPRDKKSEGCNWLIKTNRAELAESASDIAESMNWLREPAKSVQASLFLELEPEEQALVDILSTLEDASIDRLSFETRLSPGEIASILLNLELKGIVKSLPGKRFILV